MCAVCETPWKGMDMSSRKIRQGICAAAAVLALNCTGGAATIYVNGGCGNDGWTGTSPVCAAPDGPKATIQAAIDSTFDGDEVIVADGVYTGPGNRDMSFGGRHIVLRSENGPAGCTIDCQGAGRAFIIGSGGTDDPVIQGLTMANGSAFFGGAAQIDKASASFSDCIFTDNSATTILIRVSSWRSSPREGSSILFRARQSS